MNQRSTPAQPELAQRLQDILDQVVSGKIHSALLGVRCDDGSINVRVAAGTAEPGDAYFIASITKIFTASIVMQLVDEKLLKLTDRVVSLLPDLDLTGLHRHQATDYTGDLEVHHLLHQTSGLADYFDDGFVEDFKKNRDRSYSVGDTVEIARTSGANFPPGDRNGKRSAYSDTNYQLLTAIIEAATGNTYAEAVRQRITEPLGLADTYVVGEDALAPDSPPLTIHHKGKALDLPRALASEQGAGGIVSTLDDQLRFSAAYHQGQLFDRRHTALARRWNRIFFPLEYGYGIVRYRLPRWMTGFRQLPELIGHSGATNSFTFYAPDLGCHIAGTLNDLDKPARAFKLMTKVANTIHTTKT